MSAPALLTAASAHAAAFDISDSDWEGISELFQIAKQELGPDRVRPVATLDWSTVKPDDGILFLHPMQPVEAGEASEFMRQGGRIAMLDDFGRGDELMRRFKIQRVPIGGRPVAALRRNPELPIAEPWLEVSKGQISAPHPVVANVKRIVLNHPMALTHPDLSPVLKVRLSGADSDAIVAVAGQVDKGRLFVMTDPSAVINSMLRYPGNRAFAAGLVRYLASEGDRTTGRLFILSNTFKQEGSVGGDRSFSDQIENFLKELAEGLANARKDGLPGWLLAIFAGLGVLALAAWVARASGRPYKSPLPRHARPTPLVARGGVAGRFAMLAAPSSPRALALLELKSALFEGVGERFELGPTPSGEAVLSAVRGARVVDDAVLARLEAMVQRMTRTEAAMLAGSGQRIGREVVLEAHAVVREVIEACGVLERRQAPTRSLPVQSTS